MYAFAAYDLRPGEQQLEDGEQIELRPTAWDDVIDKIRSGDVRDAKTIAAVLMFDRFHRGK